MEGSGCFFEEIFAYSSRALSGWSEAKGAKVFWFFFFKKEPLLASLACRRWRVSAPLRSGCPD
jgi:hypothetical protein